MPTWERSSASAHERASSLYAVLEEIDRPPHAQARKTRCGKPERRASVILVSSRPASPKYDDLVQIPDLSDKDGLLLFTGFLFPVVVCVHYLFQVLMVEHNSLPTTSTTNLNTSTLTILVTTRAFNLIPLPHLSLFPGSQYSSGR